MPNSETIKIGVMGVGYLGEFHVQQLQTIPNVVLVGLFDLNVERGTVISKKYNVKFYEKQFDLISSCDGIIIATPTNSHYKIAKDILTQNKHVFIEKPITTTTEQANSLIKLANKNKLLIQVGHIERFNPAFILLKEKNMIPQFIEVHRLASFKSRGNDISVVLDLMIHDIDIILAIIPSKIIDIQANGVNVITSEVDIANARVEFENGCVANLTASRISQKIMRKMRLFQESDYITIDFQNSVLEEYKVYDKSPSPKKGDQVAELGGAEKKYVLYRKPDVPNHDALREELIHFADSILNVQKPETDGLSATMALSLALEIQKIIDS